MSKQKKTRRGLFQLSAFLASGRSNKIIPARVLVYRKIKECCTQFCMPNFEIGTAKWVKSYH